MISFHWFRHWDRIFWIFFLLMCVTIIAVGFARIITFEFVVLFGVFMIIIGAGKLASEISHRKLVNYQNDIYQKMHQMSQHLEKTFNLANMNKDRNEFRVIKLHESSKETKKTIDRNYRDLARKIIDVENKLNKVSRMTPESKVAVYAGGTRLTFSDKVLTLVKQVPRGKVTTFSEVARTAERPRSQRLVGKIIADNVYLKSIPTHRVVSVSGKVPGTGGMAAKKRATMLRRERVKVEKGKVNLHRHLFRF
jgi:O-6-methylguanine DNA methyltransferase